MCGIAGWVSFGAEPADLREQIEAMTATMALRGPDAGGVWLHRSVAFGHRRLAVIDLPGGAQPMVAEADGQPVALTYSGEVYNYTELRAELRGRGHRFRTESDTEVVLRAYLEWGEAVADRLNGMYAFGIWDARTEKLVLVRDRMGIKPLYYYPTPDGVLFGSEPKAILAHDQARPVVREDGLREMLTLVKTPGMAIWDGMAEVRPGTVVTLDRRGTRTHVYWSLRAKPHEDDVPTTVGRVRELLEDIVARQLVADVPRCFLLSGGLDSSAITALAGRHLRASGERARSFNLDFVGQVENFRPDEIRAETTPDAPFAREVAELVGTDHTGIVLDHMSIIDPKVRRAHITARDLPLDRGDPDNSLYLMLEEIRKHSTVALSGEAADEVFGGYRWFHEKETQEADTFPWMLYSRAAGPMGTLEPSLVQRLDLDGYIADRYAQAKAEVPVLPGESAQNRRMRVMSHMFLTRLVRVHLDGKDRIGMAVGLEIRVPYCDHRLVEYVYNTPWSHKTFDGREKSLLRAAVSDLLPRTVLARKKSPFPHTQDTRYVELLQSQVADLRSSGSSWVLELFDRDKVAHAITVPAADVDPRSRAAMERILSLQAWSAAREPKVEF